MSFVKIGDSVPIINSFDSNGKENFCPKCGKKLTAIALNHEDNELVCNSCDIEETEDLD